VRLLGGQLAFQSRCGTHRVLVVPGGAWVTVRAVLRLRG
jgi:hypothetical protein